MALNTKKYYDYGVPQGEFITGSVTWVTGAVPSLTITPGTGMSVYVTKIKFVTTNTFAMSAADTIGVTINAYDNAVSQVIGFTGTATVADDLAALMSLCNPESAKTLTLGAVSTHISEIEFKPPVYLRSSPTVVDSISIDYTATGGGITAGSVIVCYEGYQVLEANSGLSS